MTMEDIDFRLMGSLKALLEEVSVTRAAERLHVTQPSMSKKLKQLREMFGDPLIIRRGNSFQLTNTAKSLREHIRAVFEELEKMSALQPFSPQSCRLDIRLAVTDFSSYAHVPHILARLREKCPGLHVLVEQWKRIDFEKIMLGKVHCAKCHLTETELPDELHGMELDSCSALCLMRRDHPLATGEFTLDRYLECEHVSYVYDDCPNLLDAALAERGHKRRIAVFHPSVLACLSLTENSDLLLSTTRDIAAWATSRFSLTARDIPIPISSLKEYFVCRKQDLKNPGIHWFYSRFLHHYKELSEEHGDVKADSPDCTETDFNAAVL